MRTCLLLLALGAPLAARADADVTLYATADNCYAVYYGDNLGVTTEAITSATTQPGCNSLASDIWRAERYDFHVPVTDYLYLVAWSDDATYQGLIAEIEGVDTNGPWQVYASGADLDNGALAPTMATVNAHVAVANAGLGDASLTSVTWMPVTDGPQNDDDNTALAPDDGISSPFELVYYRDPITQVDSYPIPYTRRWMWFNATATAPVHVFDTGADHREFLIFRIPVREIGACCLEGSADGCTQMYEADCREQDGTFYEDFADCESTCEGGEGACCTDDQCEETTQERCEAVGGTFYTGRDCDDPDLSCCEPVGGCCLDDACVEISELACCELGGHYLGDGVICEGNDAICCEVEHPGTSHPDGAVETTAAPTASCSAVPPRVVALLPALALLAVAALRRRA